MKETVVYKDGKLIWDLDALREFNEKTAKEIEDDGHSKTSREA